MTGEGKSNNKEILALLKQTAGKQRLVYTDDQIKKRVGKAPGLLADLRTASLVKSAFRPARRSISSLVARRRCHNRWPKYYDAKQGCSVVTPSAWVETTDTVEVIHLDGTHVHTRRDLLRTPQIRTR